MSMPVTGGASKSRDGNGQYQSGGVIIACRSGRDTLSWVPSWHDTLPALQPMSRQCLAVNRPGIRPRGRVGWRFGQEWRGHNQENGLQGVSRRAAGARMTISQQLPDRLERIDEGQSAVRVRLSGVVASLSGQRGQGSREEAGHGNSGDQHSGILLLHGGFGLGCERCGDGAARLSGRSLGRGGREGCE
ncbi:hypothetical protein BS50DRAFT_643108, partial [Corynespora cassiicola Philippines]